MIWHDRCFHEYISCVYTTDIYAGISTKELYMMGAPKTRMVLIHHGGMNFKNV